MRFEARELKPYAEPVSPDALREGEVYFAVNFVDEKMLIPVMEPLVFAGCNLEAGDADTVYFQDVDSYRAGVRFATASANDHAEFHVGAAANIGRILEYEQALDVLMRCALKRRKAFGRR